MRSKQQSISISVLFLAAMFFFFSSFSSTVAQQGETNELESIMELMDYLNTPIVTSGGKAETVREAGSNITVIQKTQLIAWGCRDLQDVIARVAGFTIVYDRDETVFASRGNVSDNNQKYLLLLDGHSVNSTENFGPGNFIEMPNDLSNVKRIEVVKGPGSLAWGSGALAGVINVITMDAADLNGKSEAAIKYGSFGSITGTFQTGQVISDKASWLLSGTYYESGGQTIMQTACTGNMVLNPDYAVQAGYPGKYTTLLGNTEPSYKLQLKATVGDFKLNAYTFSSSIFDRHFESNLTRKNYLKSAKTFIEGIYDKKVNDDFSFTWKISTHNFRATYVPFEQGSSTKLPFLIDWVDKKFNSNLAFHNKWVKGISTDFAVDASWIEYGPNTRINNLNPDKSNGNNTAIGFLFDKQFKELSYGSYLVANFELTEDFKAIAGAWFDYNEFRGGDKFHASPRLALLYNLNDKNTVKAIYNHAFLRPANFQYSPTVNSEKMDQLELIYITRIGAQDITATFFTQKLQGFINIVSIGSVSSFQNSGDYSSTGLELEAAGSIINNLEYWTSVSIASTKAENFPAGLAVDLQRITPDGKQLNYPGMQGNISLTYRDDSKKFYFTPILSYMGEVDVRLKAASGTVANAVYGTIPSVFLVDIAAGYKLTDFLEARVSVHNLLNEKSPTYYSVWNGDIDRRAQWAEVGVHVTF